MKILFNGSMYSEKPTGVGIYIREVFLHLLDLQLINEESTLYVYSTVGLPSNKSVRKIKLSGPLDLLLRKSLSLHRIFWNYFSLPVIARKYDAVFSFSSHGSPFIKNQIITIHDLICMKFPNQHKSQYNYFRYALPSILKVSKKIVAVSLYTKSEIVNHYKILSDKIVVISGAANHLQKAVTMNISIEEKEIIDFLRNKQFFLTVGASYEHKNIERLISAVKNLDKENLLIVVGSSNIYYRSLQKKYADEQIHFLEYVSQSLLVYLYEHCMVNVYVSLYEGMGFPPYEAAIYNTVTIASNTTAIPEIYGNSVYYVDPLNIKAISEALQLFKDDKIDKRNFQNFFPELQKKFTWKNTAISIYSLLTEQFAK